MKHPLNASSGPTLRQIFACAQDLLRAGLVFNMLAREGSPLEVETVVDGQGCYVPLAEYQLAVEFGDSALVGMAPVQPKQGTDHADDVESHRPSEHDAELREIVAPALTRAHMVELANEIDPDWQLKIRTGGVDGEWPDLRGVGFAVRVNLYTTNGARPARASASHVTGFDDAELTNTVGNDDEDAGVALDADALASGVEGRLCAQIRVIQSRPIALDSLGLSQSMTALASETRGLLLVVGPAGAGKSATAVSYIDAINKSFKKHIVTAEAPIEYEFQEIGCRFSQREIGTNAASIEIVCRDSLRQAADVVLIGEIRTGEDRRVAYEAAKCGKLVVTTGFANGAVDAIRGFLADLPSRNGTSAADLSRTLVGVIYQIKVPSTRLGHWAFVREFLCVKDNSEVQALIAVEDWMALQHYIDSSYSTPSALVSSLNSALVREVSEGRVAPATGARAAYDQINFDLVIKNRNHGRSAR